MALPSSQEPQPLALSDIIKYLPVEDEIKQKYEKWDFTLLIKKLKEEQHRYNIFNKETCYITLLAMSKKDEKTIS